MSSDNCESDAGICGLGAVTDPGMVITSGLPPAVSVGVTKRPGTPSDVRVEGETFSWITSGCFQEELELRNRDGEVEESFEEESFKSGEAALLWPEDWDSPSQDVSMLGDVTDSALIVEELWSPLFISLYLTFLAPSPCSLVLIPSFPRFLPRRLSVRVWLCGL